MLVDVHMSDDRDGLHRRLVQFFDNNVIPNFTFLQCQGSASLSLFKLKMYVIIIKLKNFSDGPP